MPKLTIDGIEVSVEPGINLIEAAHQAGKVIPHFCYHPKLSVAGNCRMCLVEIEGVRKPEIACNTQVREGMVVRTDTAKIQKLRKGVLEFLFLNHPLDCPICDKAGECKLQDYYLEHGRYDSRLEEGKVRKPKRLDIGRHIILDTERCVLCSRCVRFCDEITKTGELRIFERGAHSQVGIYPDLPLNNRYSICTTDVCPVGALTSKEFRFQARVWHLERTPSICGGCANGCNIEVHHYRNEVKRFMPRRNDSVNDTWMCDDGRLSYAAVQATGRLAKAVVSQGTVQHPGTEAALARVVAELRHLKDQGRGSQIGAVLSPQASLEENFLLATVARGLGAQLFLVGGNPVGAPAEDDDGFLIRSDKNPNSVGAQLIARHFGAGHPGLLMKSLQEGSIQVLVVLNNDVIGKAQGAGIGQSAFSGVSLMVALSTHENATTAAAQVAIPLATYLETDGTWVNAADRVQRFHRSVSAGGEVRTGLEVLAVLHAATNVPREARRAKKIFDEAAQVVPELAELTWDALGETGQVLKRAEATAA